MLQQIFKNKIIPLLQEYFFSNLKHIGLVLNDNPDDNDERKIIKDQILVKIPLVISSSNQKQIHCLQLNSI